MILEEALKQLVAEFGEGVKTEQTHTHEISSAGRKLKHSDPEPALYISQELAVKEWLQEMRDFLSIYKTEKTSWKITSGPHLDKWMITVTNKSGQHRVAEPRWSVTAKVWIETATLEKTAGVNLSC